MNATTQILSQMKTNLTLSIMIKIKEEGKRKFNEYNNNFKDITLSKKNYISKIEIKTLEVLKRLKIDHIDNSYELNEILNFLIDKLNLLQWANVSYKSMFETIISEIQELIKNQGAQHLTFIYEVDKNKKTKILQVQSNLK